MSALLDNGLEVTAQQNHFFFEQPRIFYMHVHGHGKAVDLAQKLKLAIDLLGHVNSQTGAFRPATPASAAQGQIDTAKIAKIVGHEGEQTGALYKITVGRDDLSIKEMALLLIRGWA
jgi:hypothetical protein